MAYLPDIDDLGKQMPREFLIKVLFKVRPDFMKSITTQAIDIRNKEVAFS